MNTANELQFLESEFKVLLSGIGGKENILLIGEVWEKQPSRELLFCLINKVFSGTEHPKKESTTGDLGRKQNNCTKESHSLRPGSSKHSESPARDDVSNVDQLANTGGTNECKSTPLQPCSPGYERGAQQATCSRRVGISRSQPARDITSPLIIFIFRQDSMTSLGKADQTRIKTILKDVRNRSRSAAEPALVGVVVPQATKVESTCSPETARQRLDTLLRVVFRRADSDTVQVTCFAPELPDTVLQVKTCIVKAARAWRQETNAAQKNSSATRLWCFPCTKMKKKRKKSYCNQPERCNVNTAEGTEETISLRRQSHSESEIHSGETRQDIINELRD